MVFMFCGKQFDIDTGPRAPTREIKHAGLDILVSRNFAAVRNPGEFKRAFKVDGMWCHLEPGGYFCWSNPCATHAE